MAKHKEKIIDTTPNCTTVQYQGLPKKTFVTTDAAAAIQQYRRDYRLSHLRPDKDFVTDLIYEMPREKR